MPKAVWNGVVIAESDSTVMVEGNHYFPLESLKMEHFVPSDTVTTCAWKGKASYYTVSVQGDENRDAAWIYRDPSRAAAGIKDHVAFWRGIRVED